MPPLSPARHSFPAPSFSVPCPAASPWGNRIRTPRGRIVVQGVTWVFFPGKKWAVKNDGFHFLPPIFYQPALEVIRENEWFGIVLAVAVVPRS
ncbi:hypothetical protein, partial [Prosthecobacter sp.]|uniref:hypothetical protein n=1 Tax=Prosthecobacter sp. TaxID=1965333 RepID=UPI002AB8C151